MYFTQDDYRKIEQWLSKNSVKDTEFNEAITPFNGKETVAIVQNGHNAKASISDIVKQMFLLGVSDFLNVTDKYGEKYITLTDAIRLIPYMSRKIGQVITFLNTEGNWELYQFQGESLLQWNNNTLWVDLLAEIAAKVNVVPDEEDITGIRSGDKTIIKFKDKQYNPDEFSGLGRIYLRKNIVDIEDDLGQTKRMNLLQQSMLSKENTIYIIQYDYDLNGQEIIVPKNCVLQFEGGSFSNGTLIGNKTIINAGLEKILSSDITINGTYNIDSIYPEWFYAGTEDYSNAIQFCISLSKISTTDNNINIVFCSGKNYNIGKPILIDTIRINLLGNNCSLIKITSETGEGTFTEGGNNIDLSLDCFFYTNRNMYYINISDFNLLVLDSELQNNVYGFFFPYINRSTIKNIKSYYLYEGLTTIDSWQNIFENIVFDYCSNCGFNISGGTSTFINKCWVTHSDTSYKISNLYYSILNCTASDFSKTSYNIQNCCITLNGCGCELTDNSFAVLTSGARVLLNNFFFVGDNNIDKEVFAFIGDSYIEFNNSEIRNTYKLLKCMESKVVINNCNISNWEIGFNSGIIIRTEKDKKLIFREEFGNNWSVLEFYNNIFSSDNRPNLTEYDISVEIYDSTLKKKILWNGTTWTNLDGTPLE